jgi:hypothetical protein
VTTLVIDYTTWGFFVIASVIFNTVPSINVNIPFEAVAMRVFWLPASILVTKSSGTANLYISLLTWWKQLLSTGWYYGRFSLPYFFISAMVICLDSAIFTTSMTISPQSQFTGKTMELSESRSILYLYLFSKCSNA